jgi:hypothetical protein
MDELEERVAALEHVMVTFLAAIYNSEQVEGLKAMAEEKRVQPTTENVTLLRPSYHGIPSPIVDRIQALFDRVKWARGS